jgi:hypothetical protein
MIESQIVTMSLGNYVLIDLNLVKALDVIIFHKGNVTVNFSPVP